jgi:single-stranded DNA-binding protein
MVNAKNMCIFNGRIARVDDPVSRKGANGDFTTVRFSIAVDRVLTKEQKEKAKRDQSIKTCDFIPCEAIGATADTILKWMPKGKSVTAVCTYDTYESINNKTGEKYYGHQFKVEQITFSTQDSKALAEESDDSDNGGYRQSRSNKSANKPTNNFSMDDDDDEDEDIDEDELPFGSDDDDDDEQDW